MTKDSEVHLKNCLLIENCSISLFMNSLVGLVDARILHRWSLDQISGRVVSLYRDKTLEYSEIYRKQLTLEHFFPYNYSSSTLPAISRNIS
jgi:hypothetical protein